MEAQEKHRTAKQRRLLTEDQPPLGKGSVTVPKIMVNGLDSLSASNTGISALLLDLLGATRFLLLARGAPGGEFLWELSCLERGLAMGQSS